MSSFQALVDRSFHTRTFAIDTNGALCVAYLISPHALSSCRVEAYKERHGKPPAKEQVKGKYVDVYPAADLDLLDAAIERVLKRYAKSS